ncbi:TetR/AcrR family transcriptional regulator [Spirosoma arcticum]
MKDPWILAGYALLARKGPADLKIEVLARQVGKSKSSFYHHFADTEVFTEQLLSYHMERVQRIADLERQCLRIVPDLLRLLMTIEEDLLFNRQLRSHRTVPAFRKCIERTNREITQAILPTWAEAFELADRPEIAQLMLNLVIDNFYLQLTNQTLTYEWLLNYVSELRSMVRGIANMDV